MLLIPTTTSLPEVIMSLIPTAMSLPEDSQCHYSVDEPRPLIILSYSPIDVQLSSMLTETRLQ